MCCLNLVSKSATIKASRSVIGNLERPMKKLDDTGVYPGKKSIQIQFTFMGRRRERLRLSPTSENIKYCIAKRQSIMNRITLGKFGLEEYEEEFPDSKWLKQMKHTLPGTIRHHISEALTEKKEIFTKVTNRCYGTAIKGLLETKTSKHPLKWGDLKPKELTPEMIEEFVRQQQAQRRVSKTIRNKLIPLRNMYRKLKIVPGPCDLVVIERPQWELVREMTLEEIDPFDVDEMRAILNAASGALLNMVRFWYSQGLRNAEIFGVAWEDIDFVHGTIRIRRGWTEDELGVPKTGGLRTIPLMPQALRALRDQKQYTFALPPVDCSKFGFGELSFVFRRNEQNDPWTRDQQFSTRVWRRLLKMAGVRYRYPNQLRHVFASMCISAGENEKWLAEMLGHKTVEMLRNHYAKYLAQAAAAAGQKGGDRVAAVFRKIADV
jgi:integrase